MYKVEMTIIQRDQVVELHAVMYERTEFGVWVSLGDIPSAVLPARSKGHDWLGDSLVALKRWVEMSLF